jgi:hypothetical protein
LHVCIDPPVMEADLEPGLAWIVMATEEGGTARMQDGKLFWGLGAVGFDWVDTAAFAFAFPFLAGAIFFYFFPFLFLALRFW